MPYLENSLRGSRTLRDSNNFAILELRLPKYLAEWLKEFAKEIAMDPSQLIANILHYYYEAYKKGFERGYSQTNVEKRLESSSVIARKPIDVLQLAERFIEEGKAGWNDFIVRKFALWTKDKLLNISQLDHNIVDAFLEEYTKDHKVKKTSVYSYRRTLKRFVEFALQAAKQN